MLTERSNIVIVGGGVAGLQALKSLSSKLDPLKHDLILITARPYFTHLAGTIRAIVTPEGNLEDRIWIPYDSLKLDHASHMGDACRIVIGKVASLEDDGVQVGEGGGGGNVVLKKSGERIRYSVLVLATGRRLSGPLEFPDTREESDRWIEQWRARIERARRIVLVGGGAAGVEMAGEIKDYWPTKTVTIVHRGKQLLDDTYPSALRERVAESLQARNVTLILRDCVDSMDIRGDGTILARKTHAIEADLVIPMRGVRPNTEFLSPSSSSSLGEEALTSQGYVKVRPTLQLREHPRIFAAGDIIDWDEHKQVSKCTAHVTVLVSNVVALLEGREVREEYRDTRDMIVISNGKMGGTSYFSYLGGITYGDWLSTSLKSKSLMLDSTRKTLGFS